MSHPTSIRAPKEMYFVEETLDDALKTVFEAILAHGRSVPGTRGEIRELTGVLIEIKNPRNRLSLTETKGKLYSAVGELLWYLSGTDGLEFIAYYIRQYEKESEDKKTVYGAYGPRIFQPRGASQMDYVLDMLRTSPSSKRAVLQIFSGDDIKIRRQEIPCTCTLQFLVRDQKVNLVVNMRSNDAYFGLPHDVFAFTMIQEIVARVLGYEIGTYKHMVGSLHLYDYQFADAQLYGSEGFQPTTQSMPQMPEGDPRPSLAVVLAAEEAIRSGREQGQEVQLLEPYWQDILRLLEIFSALKRGDCDRISSFSKLMSTRYYDPFIQRTISMMMERNTR